jgi:hypothetical protein
MTGILAPLRAMAFPSLAAIGGISIVDTRRTCARTPRCGRN